MKSLLIVLVPTLIFCVSTTKAQIPEVTISSNAYEFELLVSDIDQVTKTLLNEEMKNLIVKKFEKRISHKAMGLVKSSWFSSTIQEAIRSVKFTSIVTGDNPITILSTLEERYKKEVAVARAVALFCKDSFIEEKSNEFLVTQETALLIVQWARLEYQMSIQPPTKKSPTKIRWCKKYA